MWHLIFPQNLSIEKKKDSISLLFMCKNIEGGTLKEITISSSIKGRTNLSLNEQLNSYLKDKRSPTIPITLKLQHSCRKEVVSPIHTNLNFLFFPFLKKYFSKFRLHLLITRHQFINVFKSLFSFLPYENKEDFMQCLWFRLS